MTKQAQRIIDRAIVESLLREAFALSREHARLVQLASCIYGGHGPVISGIVHDHFPDAIKDRLRNLCTRMNNASAEASMARPRNMRRSTMRKIRDEIRHIVGTGIYL